MVMTGKDDAVSVPGPRDSGDPLTQFLIEYLQGNTPEGTLDEVYRLVEVSRKVAFVNGGRGPRSRSAAACSSRLVSSWAVDPTR